MVTQATNPGNNRSQRRHPDSLREPPQRVLKVAAPTQPQVKLKFFVEEPDAEREVVLGDNQVFHLARHTAAGIGDIQQYLTTSNFPSLEADTSGESIVNGIVAFGAYDKLQKLLEKLVDEKLPEYIAWESDTTDLTDTINKFFETSGLRWLDEIIKNSGRRTTELITNTTNKAMQRVEGIIDEKMPEMLSAIGTANSQASSILSSSTAPESQPEPTSE